MKTIVAILVSNRREVATRVQSVLTSWGCMIRTRLGLHGGVLDECTDSGLIVVELVGEEEKRDEFVRKLSVIKGVDAKRIDLALED
ncbi:MAG: hypothetical protein ACQETZ_02955 [Candidatus Fermentibacterota bacterium]